MLRNEKSLSKPQPRERALSMPRLSSPAGEVSGANRSILRRSLGVGEGVREGASLASSKRVSFADDDHIESVFEYPKDRVVAVAMDKGSVCCQLW